MNLNKNNPSDNFKKAYADLAGLVGLDATPKAPVNKEPAPAERVFEPTYSRPDVPPVVMSAPPPTNDFYAPPVVVDKSLTVIAAGTVLTGNITTDGSVSIAGKVTGDVIAKASLLVTGVLVGNASADALTVSNGSIVCEHLDIATTVLLDHTSTIQGNITCDSISINAKVTGGLVVRKTCVLKNTAVVMGNIQTGEISVELGAVLKGSVEITAYAKP